jgi:hypothetical protein
MRAALAAAIAATFAAIAVPSGAQAFEQVREQSRFVDLITSKKLKRFGIELTVTPQGRIEGRAFGRPVSGDWAWNGGYFCRSLFWGERNLGDNCQAVLVSGDTLRFISDQGAGDYADLRLE